MSQSENFPVGSLLIRRDLRPMVHVFYRFARDSDDVADDPGLAAEAKLQRLAWFEAGLDGDSDGAPQGLALASLDRPEPSHHARQLLAAFRWDARGGSCATWGELLAYCEDSANPVGRFLLNLHDEGRAARVFSDQLCTALQVLNHLQDLRADHLRLGRHYLPADWIVGEGARLDDLGADRLSPQLRRAVDRALDQCDALLTGAENLPGVLRSRRLAAEATTILWLARRLSRHLREQDPLAGRVALSRLDFARAGVLGALVVLRGQTSAQAQRSAWEEEA
ncbi:squalene/phytoene synthase family protein [Rubellimicrobium roseum]|nr:squalene/phytoene synthase family protein [Rubellimicrobium roseum]